MPALGPPWCRHWDGWQHHVGSTRSQRPREQHNASESGEGLLGSKSLETVKPRSYGTGEPKQQRVAGRSDAHQSDPRWPGTESCTKGGDVCAEQGKEMLRGTAGSAKRGTCFLGACGRGAPQPWPQAEARALPGQLQGSAVPARTGVCFKG